MSRSSGPVVDCHNDLILLLDHHRRHGNKSYFRDSFLPQLVEGGVRLQVAPLFVDETYRPEAALRRALLLLELLHEEIERNADLVTLCLTGADIAAALQGDKIAFVLALEGCEHIGDNVCLLHTFFRLGVRMASFTHFGRTMLADGSAEDAAGSRLTEAGIEAVRLMESLKMIVDVSHLNMAGTDHVLALSTRPVIASHSSARALCDVHRNLTDDRLKAIAGTGGVIGVNFFPLFVDGDQPTLARLIDHVAHIASVAGVDHIGLGPDFMRELAEATEPVFMDIDISQVLEGTQGDPRDFPVVADALLERGFSNEDTDKIMGGNFLRFLQQALP